MHLGDDHVVTDTCKQILVKLFTQDLPNMASLPSLAVASIYDAFLFVLLLVVF